MRALGFAGWTAWVLALSLACERTAEAQQALPRLTQYGHSSWHVQSGQFSSPNGITQTKDGYLWLATDAGVVRFDGVSFVPASTLPGMSMAQRSRATAIHASGDDSLWFALGQQIFRVKDGQTTSHPIKGLVSQFAEDESGLLWASLMRTGGRGGVICRMAAANIDCLPPADLPLNNASSLEATNGSIWVGGSGGLCQWSPTKRAECHLQAVLKPQTGLTGVQSILTARDGTQWIGIGKAGPGLGLGQFSRGIWKPYATTSLDGSTLAVSALMEDRDGALWIGTSDRGLFRIHNGQFEHFGRADGLSSDTIPSRGLFQDREGTVWVLTASGIDAFTRLPVSTFSVREGLPADAVESVLVTRDGTVWFGNQSLSRLVNGQHLPPPNIEFFQGKEVTSLLEDQAGRLWIGLDNTLNIFQQGALKPVRGLDVGPVGPVEFLTQDTSNDVWASPATRPPRQLLRIRNDQVVQRISIADLIPGMTTFRAIAPGPKGGLLIGLSNGGIASLRDGKVEIVSDDDLPGVQLNQLFAERDGTVVGTSAKGLVVKRGTSRSRLNLEHGLPCESLKVSIRDGRGDMWLRGDCGLMQIAAAEWDRWLNDPSTKIQVRHFDQTDGARPGGASFSPMASLGPDGHLWFANGKIAQVIEPALVATRRPAPNVLIEHVTVDRAVLQRTDALQLPARPRDVAIRYTATSFIAPQKIKFRYRLEGRDEEWTDAGVRREAFYTDLPPGNYRFRVIASNADGVWNEVGATQAFRIPPLFYQTTWFLAFCVSAAGVGLYALYRFRLHRVATRLKERIEAKNAERERIARELHDTLLQSTEGLILQLHAASSSLPEANPVRQSLTKALDRAGAVVAEGRDRVLDLRTSEAAVEALPQALASVGHELARDTAVDFCTTIEGRSRTLDKVISDELYRIGREALLNAHRHAAARQIEVQIIYDVAEFRMRVRDDGVGIGLEGGKDGKRKGHWGLQGMRERAQHIGAEFNVWSRPGAGTEIEVRVPGSVAYEVTSAPARWMSALRFVGK